MFLLVPAHLGCPGQIPQSRKMVVCVCVLALSAGMLKASAGTLYQLVLAHFYPCPSIVKKEQFHPVTVNFDL